MGDYYYSLRAGAVSVRTLLRVAEYDVHPWDPWGSVDVVYAALDRSSSIPFGGLAYSPRDWEHDNRLVGDEWHVCCSIKTAGYATLDYFLAEVLTSLIAEPCLVEWYHEDGRVDEVLVLPGGGTINVRTVELDR